MQRTISILFLFVLIAAAADCNQAEPPSRDLVFSSWPILGGTPDLSQAHMGVVFLELAGEHGGWYCSGTLITPTVVLTAAHCAQGIVPESCTVYFGPSWGNFDSRKVDQAIVHPDYDDQTFVNDIAMLLLQTAAPEGIDPIPHLPADLAITNDDIGTDLEFVGFGRDENDEIGRKLKVFLPFQWLCNDPEGCLVGPGYHAADKTICYGQGDEGGICSGDSGGPAFIDREGQEYVAGVTSYGGGGCTYYGCSTKVDAFHSFIEDVVGSTKVLGQSCTRSSQCYSGYCVDGVCCESVCADPCMVCNLPRQGGTCLVAEDGYPCPDGDLCNGDETCVEGVCVTGTPPECTSDDPCLEPECDPVDGCVLIPGNDGVACDNENPCDGDDQCLRGECVSEGVPLDCSDDNPCTRDSCAPATGCQHTNVPDGTDCGDGDACNGDEVCSAGTCTPGTALDCDDNNPCTDDACDPAQGCVHTSHPDGEKCGDCRTCQGGLCLPKGDCGGGCATTGTSTGIWLLVSFLLILPCGRRGRRQS